jgi:hypothetical protein
MQTELYLLQLVVVDDVLVGRAALGESIQLVHVIHVAPQAAELWRNLKVHKVLSCKYFRDKIRLPDASSAAILPATRIC